MAFCDAFVWGVATASYQIEGAVAEDGRKPSVWDAFAHEPGRIYQNENGDVACDHYHRYADDLELMANLGIRNYRFSMAWPRLIPDGCGKVNEKGVDYYNRLIDTMLEHGIRPFATLFHWDLPMNLERQGAWYNPDSPKWFAEYAALCAQRFGDRVKDFITFNEPQCFVGLGYREGEHAPGLVYPVERIVEMSHRVLIAHGLGVQAIRANAANARIGYAPTSDACYPVVETPENIEAARKAFWDVAGRGGRFYWGPAWFSDPAILGAYPADAVERFKESLPEGWQEDLKTICQPLDFYCQNIYRGVPVRAADNAQGYEILSYPMGHGKTAIEWPVTPEALYWGPRFLCERYKLPFYISENGMSGTDWVALDGAVHDPARIDYTHRYLRSLKRAAEEGYPIQGYFHWTFMDNFEWAKGYNDRFGLVYVDYATQQRIPKDSAYWYKQVIESNGENL